MGQAGRRAPYPPPMRTPHDPIARRRLAALCALAAAAGLTGVAVGSALGGDERDGDSENAARSSRDGRAPAAGRDAGAGSEEGPPIEQQVGQLLLMSFDGTSQPEYIRRRLRRGEGAGVILFAKNALDAEGLDALTAQLQRAGRGGALVATDQEGGDIRSVPFAEPETSQGSLPIPAEAAAAAGEGASQLRDAGVNVNLAPVADVASGSGSIMSGRAYPGGAELVTQLVAAAVDAHEDERVAATAKHFPGLGAAEANTDDAAVTIDSPRPQLERRDLPPFEAAIEAEVPLIMASHALYPALDQRQIASQSRAVLVDLLRDQLSFRGVVVTDSIEAQAVLERADVATAAERSIAAGADLVLMSGSNSWNEVYPALLERARRDSGFRARVAEAATRVRALKSQLGLRAPRAEP